MRCFMGKIPLEILHCHIIFEDIYRRSAFQMFCMVHFEAGKLQFNGMPSFYSTSKPFSGESFR